MQEQTTILKNTEDNQTENILSNDDFLKTISKNYTIDELKDFKNSIMIVPDDIKTKILKIFHADLNNVKIMTLSEWKQKFYFTYDEHAIYYLTKKYHYCYDVAVMYLKRMYEVEHERFDSPKIEKVINLKQELIDNGLMMTSVNFKTYIKNKKIIFYGFDFISKNDEKVIRDTAKIADVTITNTSKTEYKHEVIYEFKTIEDEVRFVAEEICRLKEEGINFNNIKLCGVVGEYTSLIDKIFSWYHIPITIKDNYLYSTSIGQAFLKQLDKDGSKALKYIEDNYALTNVNNLNFRRAQHILYTWRLILKQISNVLT